MRIGPSWPLYLPKTARHDFHIKYPQAIPKIETTNHGIKSLTFQGLKVRNKHPDDAETPIQRFGQSVGT